MNFHSFEQVVHFLKNDPECLKCIAASKSVYENHRANFDAKKMLSFCHHSSVKIARLYNKKVSQRPTYADVFTPGTISRVKYFVFENLNKETETT